MTHSHWMVALVGVMALVGCDSGDTEAEQPATIAIDFNGLLPDGFPVQLDGTSVAITNGMLSAVSGQQLTLNLGEFVSEPVAVHAELTLFELFAITPSTDALELDSLLRDYDYRGEYAQLSNLLSWLLVWDQNFDLSDGLQARPLDMAIMTDGLNLAVPFREFNQQQLRPRLAKQGWEIDYPVEYGLLQYYQLHGLKVSGQRLIATEYYDADGLYQTYEHVYDETGLKARSSFYNSAGELRRDTQYQYHHSYQLSRHQSRRYLEDGSLYRESIREFQYDQLGNEIAVDEQSLAFGGVSSDQYRTNRSAQGLPLQRQQYAFDEGVLERSIESYWRYNELHQLLEFRVENDSDRLQFGLEELFVSEFEYDEAGNPVLHRERIDWQADGVIDNRSESRSQFDAQGRLIEQTQQQDYDGDGQMDTHSRHQYQYSDSGYQTFYRYDYDGDNDGQFDFNIIYQYQFDEQGNRTGDINYRDYVDDMNYGFKELHHWQRDAHGNVTLYQRQSDDDGDGTIDRRYRADYQLQYDNQGRVIVHQEWLDSDGDGEIDSYSRHYSEFDSGGYLLETGYSNDENGAGNANASSRQVRRYQASDDMLLSLFQDLIEDD